MNPSVHQKLQDAAERHREIAGLLAQPEVIGDQQRFRALSREYAQLEPVVGEFLAYQRTLDELRAAREMAEDRDPEVRAMAREEVEALERRLGEQERALRRLLLPQDPNDERNVFLEIRAGTGGDEAALFAGDLFRMYARYAETRGWKVEVLNASEGEHGGYKEIVARVIGRGAYSRLKFESGAHRV
ncbi:MAG TPA: PCRF domain-containing protein, partial [Chromatiales bacterium]|nr:PCRF domain-containing protein [Chromatiales bacterium]